MYFSSLSYEGLTVLLSLVQDKLFSLIAARDDHALPLVPTTAPHCTDGKCDSSKPRVTVVLSFFFFSYLFFQSGLKLQVGKI